MMRTENHLLPTWRRLGRLLKVRVRVVGAGAHLRAVLKRMGRLPPGELDPVETGMNTQQDFALKRAEALGPVFKVWWHSMYTTCVVGHARARRFLAQNRDRLPTHSVKIDAIVPGGAFRTMDGEKHRHYRRLFVEALQATPPSSYEADARRVARKACGRLLAAGAAGPVGSEEIIGAYREATNGLMLRVLFGIDPESDQAAALRDAYRMFGPEFPARRVGPAQVAAFTEIQRLLQPTIDAIRRGDRDLVRSVLKHMVESGEDDATALGNLMHILDPAQFDTFSLWRWITKYLSESPAIMERLAGSLNELDRRALAEAVVLETLRLNQSEVLFRTVKTDMTLEGHFLPKGSNLRVCLWEGHKDASIFPEPFAFRPDRFLERSYSIDEFAPFGLDGYRCVGSDLVVGASAFFVEELASSLALTVVEDGPPVFGAYHWEPSPNFRVAVKPAGPG